jgi:hypothetical protein
MLNSLSRSWIVKNPDTFAALVAVCFVCGMAFGAGQLVVTSPKVAVNLASAQAQAPGSSPGSSTGTPGSAADAPGSGTAAGTATGAGSGSGSGAGSGAGSGTGSGTGSGAASSVPPPSQRPQSVIDAPRGSGTGMMCGSGRGSGAGAMCGSSQGRAASPESLDDVESQMDRFASAAGNGGTGVGDLAGGAKPRGPGMRGGCCCMGMAAAPASAR